MKKTKFLTRLGAVVFALAILVAMSVPAVAVDTDTVNVYTGAYDATNNPTPAGSVTGNSIPINKTIVVFNTDGSTVRLPNISYGYTVAPVNILATDSVTVNDGNNTEHVKSGITDGVTGTSANIVFADTETVAAPTTGVEVTKSGELTFHPAEFSAAGIYRYMISEVANPGTVRNAGLEPRTTTYDTTRYLDIYVNNPDATHQTFWMSGAVIFKTQQDSTNGGAGKDSIDTSFEKTTGFEPDENPDSSTTTDYTDDATVDRYFTYNVEVTKNITGNLADKTHKFPFDVRVDVGTDLTRTVTFDIVYGTTPATGTISRSTSFVRSQANNNGPLLADGETYRLVGLPRQSTITVSEYNNTDDEYHLTTAITGSTATATHNNETIDPDAALNNAHGESGVPINSGNSTKDVATTNTVITFTNHLSNISPTGLAFRIAPYVLMLTAGISLILLFAKRRREVTDMI